jgi:peptide/nickel transport system substrate-binding protein
LKTQAPGAICEVTPGGISRNLIVNRDAPPFDNPDMRRAMALSLDRKAFIDILSDGQGDIGGVMQPLPEGVWGMPQDVLKTLPGYDPDVQKNRNEARQLMQKLGYGPENRLALKVSTRNIPPFRDPAVVLTDQLKEVFIDGELDIVETALWYWLPSIASRTASRARNRNSRCSCVENHSRSFRRVAGPDRRRRRR